MKRQIQILICCGILAFSCACAYRHYMGMHGPSIQAYPDIHGKVSEDQDCLGCHHPDQAPTGPATSHPGFTGCLKCHNDSVG